MCAGRRLDLPVVHERMKKAPEDLLPGAFFGPNSDRLKQVNEE
jgi:ATP phosphoribosyltransferase